MDATITRLIESGAMSHLCMYHARLRPKDPDWFATKSYAMRTFPQIDADTIDRLIHVCKTACSNATLFSRPGEAKPCGV
jgi:hypothetical protein